MSIDNTKLRVLSTATAMMAALATLMKRNPGLSLIIPAYNEENAIAATLEEVGNVMKASGIDHEIIVVDDGSKDKTSAIADSFPGIKVLRNGENRGYGASLKAGIRIASYDHVAITDADGTYPNKELPAMFEQLGSHSMIVGARTGGDVTYSTLRKIPKAVMKVYMEWIAQQKIPDINSGLRIFKTELGLKYLPIFPDGFSFTTTITLALMCNHYKVKYIPIDYFERIGSSHIKPIRDTIKFFQLIARTGMYFAPMRILGPFVGLGFLAFLASLVYDLFVIKNLTDKSILFLTFSFNLCVFASLADMIRKFKEI